MNPLSAARSFGVGAKAISCLLAILCIQGCTIQPSFSATEARGNASRGNWYERSFYLLHEDYHTVGEWKVGREADPQETARLVALSKPDVVQIHAKGNPGWTTYPSRIGYTPPLLARDVLAVWRDMARRDGYHWLIYDNLGRDGEIMKRHPAWNRVDASGKPLDKALCYHSGVAENYLWPLIDEQIKAYQPDGFWFDGTVFTVAACYCDKCRERFTRETNLDAPRKPTDKGWTRFLEMQRQIYREFVHQTCERIHRASPECLVAVNWAYSMRMPERPDPGVNYLTGDISNNLDDLATEAHFYDGQGLPCDLMTPIFSLQQTAATRGKPTLSLQLKPPAQIEQEMACIIANGGRYFAWDNPTAEGGLVPDHNEYLADVVAPFLRKRQPYCLGFTRVPEVSLLHSAAAHYAVTQRSPRPFARRLNNQIDGAAATLARQHLNYEMVSDWRFAESDIRSPVLIIEDAAALAPETIQPLCAWVHRGGRLLLTANTPLLDIRLKGLIGWDDLEPSSLDETLEWDDNGSPLKITHRCVQGRPGSATTLRIAHDSNHHERPILTVRAVDEGQAFYCPVPLLSAHDPAHAIPESLIHSELEEVLPPSKRQLTTTAPPVVEVILRRRANRFIVHLVNRTKGEWESPPATQPASTQMPELPTIPPCRISVQLPRKPRRVALEPQNMDVANWRIENDRLQVDIPQFKIHQMISFDLD